MDKDPAVSVSSDPRLYPARPFAAASIAVFRDGRLLLASRVSPPGAGLFALPGGAIETGETMQQAALRELLEEVGVEARIVDFNAHHEIIEPDATGRIVRHFIIASFVGVWLSGEAQAGPEASDVKWVARHHLAQMPLADGVATMAARAFDMMEGWP